MNNPAPLVVFLSSIVEMFLLVFAVLFYVFGRMIENKIIAGIFRAFSVIALILASIILIFIIKIL